MNLRRILFAGLALVLAGPISALADDSLRTLQAPYGLRPLNQFSGFRGGVYPYYGHPYHYVPDGRGRYYLTDIPDENLAPPVYEGRVVTSYGNRKTVVRVQRQLARAGLYRGEIDGIIGGQTQRAIRAYESSNGLAVDGQIDSALLSRMGLA